MGKLKYFGVLCLVLWLAGCGQSQQPTTEKADWPLVWLYPDDSCQDTRTQVLVERRANLIQWADPMSCSLAGGAWQSWGRDVQVGLSQAMVVPLVTPQDAVESGAKNWSREQQIAFINDKENLIIMDPVSVAERKSLGPDKWLPIERFRCDYGKRWQAVKARYHLSMTTDEKQAVAVLIKSCPAS